MGIQETTFLLSIIFFIFSMILIFLCPARAKWIYTTFALGWAGGMYYYYRLLVLHQGGHDLSAIRTLYQTACFGTWLIIVTVEKFCETEHCKNLKTRMCKKWTSAKSLRE